MPKPDPPKGKAGKLPPWAWIAAAGVGLLLAFMLMRKGSGGGDTVPVTTQTPNDQGAFAYDQFSALTSALIDAIGAHGNANDGGGAGSGGTNDGGGSGGGGCLPLHSKCDPPGPNAMCCSGQCSNSNSCTKTCKGDEPCK